MPACPAARSPHRFPQDLQLLTELVRIIQEIPANFPFLDLYQDSGGKVVGGEVRK